jgi:hypothetical protein
VDDENESFLVDAYQRTLFDAETAEIVRATAFEEVQVAGVVDEAGEIGVFIIDALGETVTFGRQFSTD